MVKKLYVIWIKIDENLPWIELKGAYPTKSQAQEAAKEFLNRIRTRIVKLPEKRRKMEALVKIKQ
jgi:hypothetical protein